MAIIDKQQQIAVGKRLAIARAESGLKQSQIVEMLEELWPGGKPPSQKSLSNYEGGFSTPLQLAKLAVFAKIYGKPVEWFFGDDIEPANDYLRVPYYTVKASAGNGEELNHDNIELKTHLSFLTSWIRKVVGHTNVERLSLIEARGDSMEPTIVDRDTLLIDGNQQRIVNGIYVYQQGIDLLVKRCSLKPNGMISIKPDNSLYDSFEADPSDIYVVGRVVWFGRVVK